MARDPKDPPPYESKGKDDTTKDAYDWARQHKADENKKGGK